MRIPTEHFAHVPVVLLSPGLLLSPSSSEPDTSKSSWLRSNGAAGSAPASPAYQLLHRLLMLVVKQRFKIKGSLYLIILQFLIIIILQKHYLYNK